jgi:outer membrane biosynthesis protein TonB
MPVVRDLKSVLTAAETAAVAGDFKTAAAELREALAIQEATLGPSHPDLADTLNNLGVASERARQLDDAERYYRRALAVAMAAFDAGHPFVATSRANLREFCEANGRPLDPPKAAAPAAAPQPQPQAAPPPQARPKPQSTSEPKPKPEPKPKTEPPPAPRVAPAPAPASAPARRSSMGPVIIGVIVIVAIIVLVIVLGRGSGSTTAPDTRTAAATPAPAAPPPAAPPAADRSPARAGGAAASGGFPAVVNPRLCRSLETGDGEWNCDRATSPVRAGALIFLTRVRSDQNTTVQHRWYRGQELVRSAQLRVVASPKEGYRTYSRYFVTAGAAEWRVELRASDGALLHEERFVVR